MKSIACKMNGWVALVAAVAFGTGLAAPLESWHWRNPLPQGHSLFGITSGSGTFVAVGEFGTVLSSRDGVAWEIQKSGTGEPLRSVAYGNGMFVAVGGSTFTTTILTSPDGTNWTNRDSRTGVGLLGVAFGNGTFVGVSGRGTTMTSRDGITWTTSFNLFFETYKSVAFGNGLFAAVGTSGGILTSPDGRSWSKHTTGTTADLGAVACANAVFVAVGSSGTVVTSPDGINWTRRTTGTTATLNGVSNANGLFAAVAAGGAILTSPDGITWISRTSGTTTDLSAIANGNDGFVAVGSLGTILASSDGVGWVHRDSGMRNPFHGLTYGNGLYVAVGSSGAVFASPDGSNWRMQPSATTNDLSAASFGTTTFVAVGASGTIITSPDGIAWTSRSSGTVMDLKAVAFGNGTFVVAGSFSGILTSPDGNQWTKQMLSGSYDLRGLGFGKGTFVAVGEKYAVTQAQQFNFIFGPIVTSPDGVNWTDRTPAKTTLSSVAFGNDIFVAVGSTGSTWSSPDGILWTNRSSGTGGSGVAYGDGAFVAVGAAGKIASSPDGISWTSRVSGTSRDLQGIAFGNSTFVTVGDAGTILQTDSALPSAPSFAIQPAAITNDYAGKISLNIGGLASGQTAVVETFLDENANGRIDSDEPLLQSFAVTDGLLPAINGVRNTNVPGDEDASANGVIRVALDLARRTEAEGIASAYVFKVSSPQPGFAPLTAPLMIAPRLFAQGVTGTVFSAIGKTPVPGALVVLFDTASSELAASAYGDANGQFVLNSPPGNYLLLGLRRGFVASLDLDSLFAGGELAPLLLEVSPNQFVKRDLTLTSGDRSISAKVMDQTTGAAIPGLVVFASSTSTNLSVALTFGVSDALGHLELPTTPGSWSITFQDKTLARLGYVNPGLSADIDSSTGKVSGVTIQLPKATALIYGSVKTDQGGPLGGVTLLASETNSGFETATTSDSNGSYVLGVTAGDWEVKFEPTELTALGYDAQSAQARATAKQAIRQDFVLKKTIGLGVPVISAFSPMSGTYGDAVAIIGTNFTGTTVVDFGGQRTFGVTVESSDRITVAVPEAAKTGPIKVTTPRGTATTTNDFIVRLLPPTIDLHPESQTVFVGSRVDFHVQTRGTPPIGYQWRLNGVPILGAELPFLELPNIQLTNAGVYSVVVSNAYGSVISSNAVLAAQTTVNPAFPSAWAVAAGGADESYAFGVAVDKAWNTYVAGAFRGSTLMGGQVLSDRGGWDGFVAKFDTAGKRVWVAQAGGSGGDAASSIAVDSIGNCYVAGAFEGAATFGALNLTNTAGVGIFLAKYTTDGNLLWVKQASSAPAASSAGLAVDAAGNLSLAGSFESTASFGNIRLTSKGGSDIFMAHYDAGGNLLWVQQAGGAGDDYGNSVSVDLAGNCFIAGAFSRTAAFGQVNLTSAGANDLFLAKYDRTGQLLWVKQAGGNADDVAFSVAADTGGGVYVSGNFTAAANFAGVTLASQGSNDVFIAKFDGAGTLDWARSAGGLGDDSSYAIALDSIGNAYLTGWFQNEAQFGATKLAGLPRDASAAANRDVFVAAYSAAGDLIWAGSAGGTSGDYANAIAVDGAGDLHVAGEFLSSEASFGNVDLAGSSNGNAFITELAGYVLRFVKPTIVGQPQSQSVTAGGDVIFGVHTEGSVPFAYQWRLNGVNVAGATNANLTIRNAQSSDAGSYSVVVSNAGGSATSSNAVLTLTLPTNAPSLSSFTPAAGGPGTLVTLNGANFTGVIDLRFNSASSGFVVLSPAQIITAVPDGATTGPLKLTVPGLSVSSTNSFTVSAAANRPPTVDFADPAAGAVFSPGTNVLVSATARDPGGAIKRVEYYASGTLVYGQDTIQLSTVWTSFTWTNVASGTYQLVAVATDDRGARGFSKTLVVTVGGGAFPPILAIERVGERFTLTWPASAAGFQLEAAASLATPINWILIAAKPSVVGDRNAVVEAASSTARFYRLRRAP